MRREYDFSKAVRGKFYRKGAELRLPIYLDPKLQSKLERIARRKGKERHRDGQSVAAERRRVS